MKSVNKVTLLGHLGKDPELAYTSSGIAKCTFSLATSETWLNDAKEKQERTDWHNIVVWRKLAEVCGQYLHRGSKVYIEGKIQTRSWDDKESGAKKYITEIIVSDMVMLDGKSDSKEEEQQHIPENKSQDNSEPPF